MKKREMQRLQADGYDLKLIAETQPAGNVKVHDTYTQYGWGVMTCLHVYSYPRDGLSYFWGVLLTKFPYTYATIDEGTEDQHAIARRIERAAQEKRTQSHDDGAGFTGQLTAKRAFQENIQLLDDLAAEKEIMKRVDIRIYVYAEDLETLNQRTRAIRKEAKGNRFGLAVFVGEQGEEYHALWTPEMAQSKLANRRDGTPISSSTMGASFPFDHVQLDDPNGAPVGISRTNGKIMFNPLLITNRRLTPYVMIAGNTRFGKSTLGKKLTDVLFAAGSRPRIFDAKGEYIDLVADQGGIALDMSGEENRINPFEISATMTEADGITIDEIGSFGAHVEKIKNMYRFQKPDADVRDMDYDIVQMGELLNDFYEQRGMWHSHPEKHSDKLFLTGLPHNQYPRLGDWVTYLEAQCDHYDSLNKEREYESTDRIAKTFKQLMSGPQAKLFDGYTNIDDFSEVDSVVFDLSRVTALGQAAFNTQTYSAMALLQADIINNGKIYRPLLNEKKIALEDIPYYYVVIDEFEMFAHEEFYTGLEWLANLMEEMAKDFAGVQLIMPTIKDILPAENVTLGNTRTQKFYKAVSKIFGLMQYRFFFNLPDDDKPRLKNALGNSVSKGDLDIISKLKKHETFLNIRGDRNIAFKVFATPEELKRYAGGVG